MKVEVDVLGSHSQRVLVISVDAKSNIEIELIVKKKKKKKKKKKRSTLFWGVNIDVNKRWTYMK